MIASSVAKRYARALFELASETKQVEKMGQAMLDIAQALDTSAELRVVIESPKIPADAKKKVMQALAQRVGGPPMLGNTLMLLADRRRLRHLGEIAAAFHAMAEEASGRIRAEIVSATKLPESYYAQLEKTLSEATGRKVTLVRREDPSLIGGVVAKVGDTVFDGSLKNRLASIRHQMLVAASPHGRA